MPCGTCSPQRDLAAAGQWVQRGGQEGLSVVLPAVIVRPFTRVYQPLALPFTNWGGI